MGEGGEAQKSCSVGVSEGGLEPPRPIRALGPQPSASAYSATPTWCTWVRADCSKGATWRRGQAGRLTVARSRVPQGVRSKPWGPGVRTAAWCSVRRGVVGRSARMAASAWWEGGMRAGWGGGGGGGVGGGGAGGGGAGGGGVGGEGAGQERVRAGVGGDPAYQR